MTKRLEQSFSATKLFLHNKKPETNHFEEELDNLRLIESKFREKGVSFNPDSLKKSLLNLRNLPVDIESGQMFEKNSLISNPLLKKGRF